VKIVKRTLLLVLFVLGVFIATQNADPVTLVLIPDLSIPRWPEARAITLPLFLVVLGALLVGGLLIAVVAAAERVRLQAGLRRARRDIARLETELAGTREKLELTSSELEQARREAAEKEVRERREAENLRELEREALAAGGGDDGGADVVDSDEGDDDPLDPELDDPEAGPERVP